jgi:predicted NAD/FAD-binding protein
VARDAAGFAARLDACGALYTRRRERGVLVLPNLARADGFDALLIGVAPEQAGDLLAALRACAGDSAAAPARLYA